MHWGSREPGTLKHPTSLVRTQNGLESLNADGSPRQGLTAVEVGGWHGELGQNGVALVCAHTRPRLLPCVPRPASPETWARLSLSSQDLELSLSSANTVVRPPPAQPPDTEHTGPGGPRRPSCQAEHEVLLSAGDHCHPRGSDRRPGCPSD